MEARSMIAGAVAFFLYANCVSWLMIRRKVQGLVASGVSIVVWAAAAFSLWFLWLART
jgi:Trk-type K+ transport system membrane component